MTHCSRPQRWFSARFSHIFWLTFVSDRCPHLRTSRENFQKKVLGGVRHDHPSTINGSPNLSSCPSTEEEIWREAPAGKSQEELKKKIYTPGECRFKEKDKEKNKKEPLETPERWEKVQKKLLQPDSTPNFAHHNFWEPLRGCEDTHTPGGRGVGPTPSPAKVHPHRGNLRF